MKRILAGLLALLLATAIWLPCLHLVFACPATDFHAEQGLSPMARQLAARRLKIWTDPAQLSQETQRMRASNAEWDFMARTYLVWALANMSLRDPASKLEYLHAMDAIIDDTLSAEKDRGMYFFLMPYAKVREFSMQPAHSLFLDGEIALMLAARRTVEEKPEYKALLSDRLAGIEERLRASPHSMLESYPNECWTFDHCVAFDAMVLADRLDGTDHSALIHDWLSMAKLKLIDAKSGLLISAFTTDGTPIYGPEGSSLWMIVHSLQLLDENFAREQYEKAKREIGTTTLGFSYAHEWPKSWPGPPDVDSGPIFPGFDISAGSSGMAFVAAASFNDQEFLKGLVTTIDFAGFPTRSGDELKYSASNQVGDAALLYAATLGPLWDIAKRPGPSHP